MTYYYLRRNNSFTNEGLYTFHEVPVNAIIFRIFFLWETIIFRIRVYFLLQKLIINEFVLALISFVGTQLMNFLLFIYSKEANFLSCFFSLHFPRYNEPKVCLALAFQFSHVTLLLFLYVSVRYVGHYYLCTMKSF